MNVKWYLKREGLLDRHSSPTLDYYLVMTGSHAGAISSKAGTRPWRIDSVYLFDSHDLLDEQQRRGVKIGIARAFGKLRGVPPRSIPTQRVSPSP